MKRSLRLRLVLPLSVTVIVAWAATAWFSYQDARDRIGAMLDDHLIQAASLLEGGGSVRGVRPALHWGEGEGAHSLLFQGWSEEGQLLFRSADAPELPLGSIREGFSEVEWNGHLWRVFGLRTADDSVLILVAEHADFRHLLASDIARHLLHPVAIALPILALLIFLAVSWGLAPLRQLTKQVGRREPTNLSPLDVKDAPSEVLPLVAALNSLFLRVLTSMENERRFTADAAHELRTPLAAIQTHAEVAVAAREDAERRQSLGHVVHAVSRANRLVGQLLELARLDARAGPPPLVPLNLAELAGRGVAEAAPQADAKGTNLGLVETGEVQPIPGDPELLGILIRNLLDNAVRYTEAGGTIDVSVQGEGDRVVLRVADSGPGIPAAERERVLERFYRGRGSGEEGSGVGLSIAARIAELHGATLRFADGLQGRGLCVEVSFPSASSGSLAIAPAPTRK